MCPESIAFKVGSVTHLRASAALILLYTAFIVVIVLVVVLLSPS